MQYYMGRRQEGFSIYCVIVHPYGLCDLTTLFDDNAIDITMEMSTCDTMHRQSPPRIVPNTHLYRYFPRLMWWSKKRWWHGRRRRRQQTHNIDSTVIIIIVHNDSSFLGFCYEQQQLHNDNNNKTTVFIEFMISNIIHWFARPVSLLLFCFVFTLFHHASYCSMMVADMKEHRQKNLWTEK